MKRYAVGIVVKDRLELTLKTLNSLFFSDQDKSTYDLYIIDNGSSKTTTDELKKFVTKSLLPIKNLIITPEFSVSKIWNLFLCITSDYQYRLKFDNDLIIPNTIKNTKNKSSLTSQVGGLTEIIFQPSNFVIGAYHKTTKKRKVIHNAFLEIMSEFCENHNVDVMSLVPVSPKETFNNMFSSVVAARRNKMPYLFGACMMIPKKTFDILGYFDERLPRRIDIEYSQRAIRNNMNIGYHPHFGIIHIGAGHSTERRDLIDQKYQIANQVELEMPQIETKASSVWEPHSESINKKLNKFKILNIS